MSLAGSPEQALATVEEIFAGRYVIDAPLPWNGLAWMFRAVEPGRSVAVAAFPVAAPCDDARGDKFLRRAKAVAELPHPALLRVSDYGIADGMPFIESELPAGPTLAEAVAQEGPFGRDRAFRVADALLEALEVVHDLSAMHWDLTPTNVILSPEEHGRERVRIVGLGFRAMLGSVGRDRVSGPGGARFVAPEVRNGQPDGRADQYSVGALLQWMTSGRAPSGPDNFGRGAGWARPVVARAMARLPHERFPDARSMRIALRKAYEGQEVPMPPRPRLRRALLWSTAGVLCLGLGIAGGMHLRALRSTVAAVDAPTVAAPPAAAGADPAEAEDPTEDLPGNPLEDGAPQALREVYGEIRAGEKLSRAELAPIHTYVRDHPEDVRGHLVLAHAFANLGWQSAAIERFVMAHGIDPTVRGDDRVLEELVEALPHPDLHHDAGRALSLIYGLDAIEPVERLLASERLTWQERERVRPYLERLKGRAKRTP